ncbi:hypothetical protein L5515_013860 [Caenorhabditis briggsae]|uniref:Uncharacterized protein n=1 Tax=Caenorhabditis briggsae TaxID=6238 RepID=A0AAE9EAD9_CAEBR|nr:hypothetical protein L5515_013860 [Caenorhabditis briggsae]
MPIGRDVMIISWSITKKNNRFLNHHHHHLDCNIQIPGVTSSSPFGRPFPGSSSSMTLSSICHVVHPILLNLHLNRGVAPTSNKKKKMGYIVLLTPVLSC